MGSSKTIDRRSFILGMMAAFAECVANECKKAALSPPFYPEDYETVFAEAENIANRKFSNCVSRIYTNV
jgi:hypothetical protein